MRLLKLQIIPVLFIVCTWLTLLPNTLAQSCSGFIPGQYTFFVNGHVLGPPTTASRSLGLVGMFRIDSLGKILYGVEDGNSPVGSSANQSITGSCTPLLNGGQILTLITASGQTQPFLLKANGTMNYIGPGAVATGTVTLQDPYASHTEINGQGSISLSGETACLYFCKYSGHSGGELWLDGVVMLGQRLNTGPYDLTGTLDGDVAGVVALQRSATGNIALQPSPSGRVEFNLSLAGEPADLPTHFVAYVTSSGDFYVLSSDPHTTAALLTGYIASSPSGSY